MRIALTIAGSDSGGGAGIQADLKTFHQFGVFGTSAVTAVTAQNTVAVFDWLALPAALVGRQIDALSEDLPPAAVKSGMLGSAAIIETVADRIAAGGGGLPNYVLDPVMVATSGDRLLDRDAEALIARRLVPLALLVTPNLNEAEILVAAKVRTPDHGARRRLSTRRIDQGQAPRRHRRSSMSWSSSAVRRFTHPRIETTSTHGTGCTLSAAIVAGLALGRSLEHAVVDGLDFVHRAIAAAPGLGRKEGHGPLNHFVPAPPRPPSEGL